MNLSKIWKYDLKPTKRGCSVTADSATARHKTDFALNSFPSVRKLLLFRHDKNILLLLLSLKIEKM
jgi:hypothetical protein